MEALGVCLADAGMADAGGMDGAFDVLVSACMRVLVGTDNTLTPHPTPHTPHPATNQHYG